MENSKPNNSLGLGTILFLIFLTLKLAQIGPVQYLSWWWVFSPIWIPILSLILIQILIEINKLYK
jgi:hypothetical protein